MEIQVRNISNMFINFWEQSYGLEFHSQKRLWKELYEKPNREIFEHLEWLFKLSDRSYNIDDDLEKCFELYGKHYDKIKSINFNIAEKIDKTCRECSEVFKISNLSLNFIVMVGLFKANAFVTPYNDRTAFYFLEKMPDKKYINILMAHEITHLFQFSQLSDDDYTPTLAYNIFTDGLACFASNFIYPGFSLSEYICMASGWEHWISDCKKHFKDIKHDIIANLDSINSIYFMKYFVGDNTVKDGIPTRIGYLIGYYVIDFLNKKYPLEEIITWQGERILKEVKNTIIDIL